MINPQIKEKAKINKEFLIKKSDVKKKKKKKNQKDLNEKMNLPPAPHDVIEGQR